MSSRDQHPDIWPSVLQRRLLEVGLREPGEAAEAWRALRPSFHLEEAERGTFEILPLLYRSLVGAGVEDPILPQLKGIYRKAWVTNSLLRDLTSEAAHVLAGRGISAMFIEGIALAERFYSELGLRPTSSIDVLVHEVDLERALAVLARAGWHSGPGAPGMRVSPSYLRDARGNVLVLRTTLAVDFVARHADAMEPLWRAAEPHLLASAEVLVPSPTDTLLSVCVAHARREGARRTQWISDAAMILASEIDWERLLHIGSECGQTRRLHEVLRYLCQLPASPVPEDVLVQVSNTRVSFRERLTYRWATRPTARFGALPSLAAEHLAVTTAKPWPHTILTFPRFLGGCWGLSSTWLVPVAAARRAGGLMIRRPGRSS